MEKNIKGSILVVEDDQYMNETLREILEDENYKVDSAVSVIDAVNKIGNHKNNYNLLILDYNLEHQHGLTGIDIYLSLIHI